MTIPRVVSALLCATALHAHSAEQPAKFRWKIVNAEISRKFAEVPTITTAELARLLTAPGAAPKPLLLDVRTPAE
ncbi:MAG TPA: hypothetical protein VFV83_08360, partial [Chthoniobacteraceae bacterium]|nr:hypothetical protein [Chthoniobacteraceae bacterium]